MECATEHKGDHASEGVCLSVNHSPRRHISMKRKPQQDHFSQQLNPPTPSIALDRTPEAPVLSKKCSC